MLNINVLGFRSQDVDDTRKARIQNKDGFKLERLVRISQVDYLNKIAI